MAQKGRHSAPIGGSGKPGTVSGYDYVKAAQQRKQAQQSGAGQTDAYGYGYQQASQGQIIEGSGAGYVRAAQQQGRAFDSDGHPVEGSGAGYVSAGYSAQRPVEGSGAGYVSADYGAQRPAQQTRQGYGASQGAHSGTARHSRNNLGASGMGYESNFQPKKRKSAGKRIVIGVVCVLAAAILALGGYILWFSLTLNAELAPSSNQRDALDKILADTPLDQPFYMLLLGSDSREGSGTSDNLSQMGDQERSDVIMLARVDAPNQTVTLVTIPRDTPYTKEDGQVVKINEMYNIGGAAASIKAVSEITGRPISHYVELRISELEAIVDAVGGVEMDVDRDLDVKDTLTGEIIYIEEGHQTLNGRQAQVFVRARHEYEDDQDGHRQSNVRALTVALAKKILDRPIYEIPATILNVAQYMTSDFDTGSLISLARLFGGKDLTMYSCTGPSDGQEMSGLNDLWLCYPNPEGWAELMRQVDTGQEPGDIDYAATQIIPDYA